MTINQVKTVLTFIAFAAFWNYAVSECMEEFHFVGTHYDFGYCIGSKYQNQIQDILANYSYSSQLNDWYNTGGSITINIFKGKGLAFYYNYGQEIQGLADGAGVTLDDIYLLNLEPEIRAYQGDAPATFEGTEGVKMFYQDAAIFTSNKYFGFTAAIDDIFRDKFFMAKAKLTGRFGEIEEFRALMLPGYLPGNFFGYNSHGVLTAVNRIYQSASPLPVATPICFIAREVIMATDIDDAKANVNFLFGPTVSLHMNVLTSSGSYYDSFEKGGQGVEDTITNSGIGLYAHFNIQDRITVSEFKPLASVSLRSYMSKYFYEPLPTTLDEFKTLMADSESTYPLYRDYALYNNYSTAATVIVDLEQSILQVYLGDPSAAYPSSESTFGSYC